MVTTQPVQCPISLESPPLCPQITPCGHVYSFTSIMQHLLHHGGDKLWRAAPCPLCFQPLVARELRLVTIRQVTVPAVGDEVTFLLLRRARGSIIPMPADDGGGSHKAGGGSGPDGLLAAGSSPSGAWAGASSGSSAMPGAAAMQGASPSKGGAPLSEQAQLLALLERQQSVGRASPLADNPFAKFAVVSGARVKGAARVARLMMKRCRLGMLPDTNAMGGGDVA